MSQAPRFAPGDPVTWRYAPPGGYFGHGAWEIPVPGVVVRHTPKRIVIKVNLQDGTPVERRVLAEHLAPRTEGAFMTDGERPNDAPMAYIGRHVCGCVSVVIVDEPSDKERVAAVVKKMIRDGMNVERIPVAAVHRPEFSLAPCPTNPNCVRAGQRSEIVRRRAARATRQDSLL